MLYLVHNSMNTWSLVRMIPIYSLYACLINLKIPYIQIHHHVKEAPYQDVQFTLKDSMKRKLMIS